ncbi:MAG TPA: hypothetical protein VHG53_03810 [Candidatus Limnocylindria bacterium]|nr:hypothetical protein [Candidatus Limnocylindria bacterium]
MSERVPDPLTSFISRSLRAEVTEVSEEIIQDTTDAEIDRVRFTLAGARRSLVIKRVPPSSSLEVRLLPHLARKTDRVATVHARGIPPAKTPGWPWLLVEDLIDAPGACDDLGAIVRAKFEIERALAADGPALAALGVPRVGRLGPLAAWPEVLVHGALGCAHTARTVRGVVLTEWRHAYLGCALADVVRLARDAGAPARELADRYTEASGRAVTPDALAAAEALL